jgi:putative lipoic acid-binding regulatory protein
MDKEKEVEAFYKRLETKLDEQNTWPANYMFKFIVPTEENNVFTVENTFNGLGAIIKTTASKTGKFTSLSIDVIMPNAQEIIQKYQELSIIKGIVSL